MDGADQRPLATSDDRATAITRPERRKQISLAELIKSTQVKVEQKCGTWMKYLWKLYLRSVLVQSNELVLSLVSVFSEVCVSRWEWVRDTTVSAEKERQTIDD